MAPARLLLQLLAAMCAAAVATQKADPAARGLRPLPSNYQMINPGRYKRDQQLACDDPKDNKPKCMAKCDKRCPNQCIVLCPGCKTFCSIYFTHSLLLVDLHCRSSHSRPAGRY